MPSAFFGLEIARRALAISQLNLQIIGHNIANAGTPGYSRQRAELIPAPPLAYPSFSRPGFVQQIGSGVDVNAIRRIRDEFLDEIFNSQNSMQGRNTVINSALEQIQLIFNEPSDTGLSSTLDAFFAAWEDLANNPELLYARANLREQSITLVRTIQNLYSSLRKVASDQNPQLKIKASEVNNLAKQIAQLNDQIAAVVELGDDPNDLKDQRDLLIEKISAIIPITSIEEPTGSVSLLIGGLRIVEKNMVQELVIKADPRDPSNLSVQLKNTLIPQLEGQGELAAILEVRDKIIPYFQGKLDRLVSALINRVNVLHKSGFGLDGIRGRPFFMDYQTAEMTSTITFPSGITEKTKLDELGITAGTFEIQGVTITISKDDVSPGTSITLKQLLDRITQAQPFVRASFDTSLGGKIRLDLYNPPDANTPISVLAGSSNFLAVTGLKDAQTVYMDTAKIYTFASGMINLSLPVRENLETIAAAGDEGYGIYPGPGNNKNALAIASLGYLVTAIDNASFSDYYSSLIGELGSQSRTASQLVNNQSTLLQQLNIQRESIRGVNLDEEATMLITYQRIYEGAARVVQVVDSMLDTLINRLSA